MNKKHGITASFVALALVCAVALLLTDPSRARAVQSEVHHGSPPPELARYGDWKVTFRREGPVEALAFWNTTEKQVFINWVYGDSPAQSVCQQVFSVSYWPTAIEALDGNRICVGGKTRRDQTVVEVWSFGAHALHVEVDGTVTMIPGNRSQVQDVFVDKSVGRDMILAMFRNRGATNSMLMLFWDSRDLYTLDVDSEQYALAFAGGGTPSLQNDFDGYWSGDHLTYGYVYGLIGGHVGGTAAAPGYFCDSNRDGVVDTWTSVPAVDWGASGLGDAANFAALNEQ